MINVHIFYGQRCTDQPFKPENLLTPKQQAQHRQTFSMSLVDESNNTPDDNTIEAQMHSLNHHHNDDDDDEYLDEEQHEQHHQPPQISQSSRYQRVKQIVTKFSNSQVFGHLLLCGSQLVGEESVFESVP